MEQRENIKFCFRLGRTAVENRRCFCNYLWNGVKINRTLTHGGYFRLFLKIWDREISAKLHQTVARWSWRRTGSQCVKPSSKPATIWTTVFVVSPLRMISKDTRFPDVSVLFPKIVAFRKSWVSPYPKMYAYFLGVMLCLCKEYYIFQSHTTVYDWYICFVSILHPKSALRISVLMLRWKVFVWRLKNLPKRVENLTWNAFTKYVVICDRNM
jgi:hypothetical protein